MLPWILWPALAYLAGTVPTGVLIGRLVGRDPRQAGSGNIGATNVTRTLGRKLGAVTLLVDVAKGALPVVLARQFAGAEVAAAAGLAAVLGHCFSVWLRFQGGKGVATTFGALLGLAPALAGLGAVIWLLCLALTRIPAVASLVASAAFVALAPASSYAHRQAIQLFALASFLVILWRHRSNLRVLRDRWRAGRAQQRRRFRPRRRARPEPGAPSASGKPTATGNKTLPDRHRPRLKPPRR